MRLCRLHSARYYWCSKHKRQIQDISRSFRISGSELREDSSAASWILRKGKNQKLPPHQRERLYYKWQASPMGHQACDVCRPASSNFSNGRSYFPLCLGWAQRTTAMGTTAFQIDIKGLGMKVHLFAIYTLSRYEVATSFSWVKIYVSGTCY
jgi:hypothetical protein